MVWLLCSGSSDWFCCCHVCYCCWSWLLDKLVQLVIAFGVSGCSVTPKASSAGARLPRPDGEACSAVVGGLADGASVANAARVPNLPGPGRSAGAPGVDVAAAGAAALAPRVARWPREARRARATGRPSVSLDRAERGLSGFRTAPQGARQRARRGCPSACQGDSPSTLWRASGALWCAGWGEGRAVKPFPHSGSGLLPRCVWL